MNPIAWYNENSGDETHDVGLKKGNNWDLYDMSGNVWEWCWDQFWYNFYWYSPLIDPIAPSTGFNRVIRGGAWDEDAQYCRSAFRFSCSVDYQRSDQGFRVLLPAN